MKIIDFLEENKGYAVAKVKFSYFSNIDILLGLSDGEDERIFYYMEIKGKRTGPYYFAEGKSETVINLTKEKIRKRNICARAIPERMDQDGSKQSYTPIHI